MVKILTLVLLVLCILYVNGLPPGSRVRRGFNNSGYGSDRRSGSGYYNQGSNERDASVSHEDGDGCNSEENYESRESRETTYGRDEYNQNGRHYEGKRPR